MNEQLTTILVKRDLGASSFNRQLLAKDSYECHMTDSVRKDLKEIQPTTECGFTLKRVRDMIRTSGQMHRTDKYSQHSSIIKDFMASLAKLCSF